MLLILDEQKNLNSFFTEKYTVDMVHSFVILNKGRYVSPNLFLIFNGICTILITPTPPAVKCHTGKLKSIALAVSLFFRKAFHWPLCRHMVGFSPLFFIWVSALDLTKFTFLTEPKIFHVFVYAHTCVHTGKHTQVCLSVCVGDLTTVNSRCKLLPIIKITLRSVYFLTSYII